MRQDMLTEIPLQHRVTESFFLSKCVARVYLKWQFVKFWSNRSGKRGN